ncbi:SulP family inorganic anion transporter [Acidaminobacter sp.]|uniref:SulP family inorganic anion transporter n=1 Tax=Acidaminobacter sp. TaxID=1872102 RepID=UPI0025652105|nr:sulfate permease [Acidaminobacter sp.]MDK9710545.1 sulfate permease [Acidaminobacter sp.]
MSVFTPKLFTTLKSYTKELFIKDLTAGVIVAIIALPLSIALGIASGVTPEQGLFTAIIAGFLISMLGGSRVQIGGPTGAFMVIVYGIVMEFGMNGLITATLMAGVMMMAMGFLRLGSIIKFIPYPITTGFTTGIAVTIFTSQIKDFLGLQLEHNPAEFLEKVSVYAEHIDTVNWNSVLIGALSLAILIFWPKVSRKVPGSLIALIVATVVVQVTGMDVATIGSTFGELSSKIPTPQIPTVSLSEMRMLIGPAFTIAILGSIESLLSAVVADGIIGSKHRSNMELVAQGVANIASGLFGGIPATGAIARTVANIKNGGSTPVAGMVHAVVLLLIMLLFMPLAKMIPLAALAAILIIVAYNMSDWREFIEYFHAPKSDLLVLLTTFFITVIFDLVLAIEIGMVLAAFLFMKRMSDVAEVNSVVLDSGEETDQDTESRGKAGLSFREGLSLPKGVIAYEISGPFFFGAADKFLDNLTDLDAHAKAVLLIMTRVPAMDATALFAFRSFKQMCNRRKVALYIIGINEQPWSVLEKAGVIEKIGAEHFYPNLEMALKQIG